MCGLQVFEYLPRWRLLLQPLALPDTVLAILRVFTPCPFQHFDSKAGMTRIVAGEVTIRTPTVKLVLATVGDELKVTH